MNMDFTYDATDNAYTTQPILLTGDAFLTLSLPERGRLAIRKSNTGERPWPIVLMSPKNKDYQIRIYGQTRGKYIKIQTTHAPTSATLDPL